MGKFEAVSGIPADAGDELDRFMSGDPSEEAPVDEAAGSRSDDPLDAWMSGDPQAGQEGTPAMRGGNAPARSEATDDDPLDAWMSGDAGEKPEEASEEDPLEAWMSGSPEGVSDPRTPDAHPGDAPAGDGFEDYVPEEPMSATDAAVPVPSRAPQQAAGPMPVPGASGGMPPMALAPVPQPELAISGDQVPNGPQGMLSVLAGCVGLALSPFALPFAVGIALIVLAAGGLGLGVAGIRTQGRMMAVLGIAMNVAAEAWRVFLMLS